jgi:hypothetical protein
MEIYLKQLLSRTFQMLKVKAFKNILIQIHHIWQRGSFSLSRKGIQHLLMIDLPSVDKEKTKGKLLAHKAFWNVKM